MNMNMNMSINPYLFGLIREGGSPEDDRIIRSIILEASKVKLTIHNPDFRYDSFDNNILQTREPRQGIK